MQEIKHRIAKLCVAPYLTVLLHAIHQEIRHVGKRNYGELTTFTHRLANAKGDEAETPRASPSLGMRMAMLDEMLDGVANGLVEARVDTPHRRIHHVWIAQRLIQARPALLHLTNDDVNGRVAQVE